MSDTIKGAALLLNENGNIDRARTTEGDIYYIESTLAMDAAEQAQAAAANANASADTANKAEEARATAEQFRAEAEAERAEAEQARALAQAKNNADQAANNAAAQGLVAVIVDDYDPETMMPNGEGQNGKMYLVPLPEAKAYADAIPVTFALKPLGDGTYAAEKVDGRDVAPGDVYVEWLWISGKWERIGLSNATLIEITTDEIDRIVAGESVVSKGVLTGTKLTYLWAQIKAAFAAIRHTHKQSDVEGLTGDLQAVRDSLGRIKVPKNGQFDCGAWSDNAQVGIVQGDSRFILNMNTKGVDVYRASSTEAQKRIGHIPYAK